MGNQEAKQARKFNAVEVSYFDEDTNAWSIDAFWSTTDKRDIHYSECDMPSTDNTFNCAAQIGWLYPNGLTDFIKFKEDVFDTDNFTRIANAVKFAKVQFNIQ